MGKRGVLVMCVVLGAGVEARADCSDCAPVLAKVASVKAEIAAMLKHPLKPTDAGKFAALQQQLTQALGQYAQHCMPAVVKNPSLVTIPGKVAVFHIYLGAYFATKDGQAFVGKHDAQWKQLLGDSKFYDTLQQYKLNNTSPVSGYFAGSMQLTGHLPQPSYGPTEYIMASNDMHADLVTAIESAGAVAANGGTPLYVLILPPYVTRETKPGSGKPMTIGGWHSNMTVDGKLTLDAVVRDAGDTTSTESHEIYETITNPTHTGWHRGSSELGDACEHTSHATYKLDGATLATIWSNQICGCGP
jgi:hypothetical protein